MSEKNTYKSCIYIVKGNVKTYLSFLRCNAVSKTMGVLKKNHVHYLC